MYGDRRLERCWRKTLCLRGRRLLRGGKVLIRDALGVEVSRCAIENNGGACTLRLIVNLDDLYMYRI